MRLQAPSGGLTIGETDNRYFRVNATTNGYQRINCNGALGYAYDGLRVDHAWQDAGNDWTALRVSADTTGGAGSGSAALAVDINSVRRFAFKTSGNIEQTGASVSADAPLWNASQTWNNAGVNFTALKVNVVNTASGSASKLLDLQVGGASKFVVDKNGAVGFICFGVSGTSDFALAPLGSGTALAVLNGTFGAINKPFCAMSLWAHDQIVGGSNTRIGWTNNGGSPAQVGTLDTAIGRNSAGVVEFNNGTAGNLRDWKARRGTFTEYAALEPTSEPSAPASGVVLFCVTSGGKAVLKVKSPSGNVGTLYTEP
jgi:hypothetical protein